METDSENTPTPKPKRGRPKSFQRIRADSSDKLGYTPDHIQSTRAKMNYALFLDFIEAWKKSTPDIQCRIMGFQWQDLLNGTHAFPPGLQTTATEIGRWIAKQPDEDEARETALHTVADARDEKVPWKTIRAHFRALRLGNREGNEVSLTKHLARAFDDYLRMFPATTHAAQVAGIRNLLDLLEPPAED